MNDDRLHRWLEAAEQPLEPNPVFGAELRETLRWELGFRPIGNVLPKVPPSRGALRRRRSPELLLVAAFLVVGGVGLAIVSAGGRDLPHPQLDLLADLQRSGQIRVAVRPDFPQVSVSGQPVGFDVDVAGGLAGRLRLAPVIVSIGADVMVTNQSDHGWDVALPSIATWRVDTSRFVVSSPYYRWRHRLVVPDTSTAVSAADLSGLAICAVAGDEGQAWLLGESGGTAASLVTSRIVTRATDDDCLAALAAGDVSAIVTADLSDADIQVQPGIKVIGGPDPEPRAAVLRRLAGNAPDPSALLRAIDDAIAAMRSDGTLVRLSETRFGNTDLVAP